MTAAEDSERRLGRAVALGLPAVGGVAAVCASMTASFGSALLVLASTALLSTIALLWTSLRTLSGDAPLPTGMHAAEARPGDADLAEKKRRLLRALKDLENERALGKIDEADYLEISHRYREEAKGVIREMEAQLAPVLEEAQRIARDYVAKAGHDRATGNSSPAAARARVACKVCAESNEPDAVFCKKCAERLQPGGGEPVDAKA